MKVSGLWSLCLVCCIVSCGGGGSSSSPSSSSSAVTSASSSSSLSSSSSQSSPAATGTVSGIVSDIGTGAPIVGATITGGGQTATSDATGQFTIAGLAQGNVSLSVNKADYAPGFANDTVSSSASTVAVSLKHQGTPQTYSNTSATTLSQTTEAGPYAVIFQPNSLDTSDTHLKVSITPLDPTKERQALPGSLVTGGVNGSPLIPVTFAEFSITDSNGNHVNLKSSSSAIVELPIPPSLRGQYPLGTKIHCYSYDSTTGAWEDFVEGTVQLSSVDGQSLVLAASVRHFSWYGGAPQSTDCIDFYVSVIDASTNKPLINARVEATPGTDAYTDANGVALIRTSLSTTPPTLVAYQSGVDTTGTLTGTAGTKYIQFGQSQISLTGLAITSCTSVIGSPPTGGSGGGGSTGTPGATGSQGNPAVVKVGILKGVVYSATAVLSTGLAGQGGSLVVILTSGVPALDGSIPNATPASGAKIKLVEVGSGTTVQVPETAAGSGFYSANLTVSAGKSYTLLIDDDGDGSVDGTGTIAAAGTVAFINPTQDASIAANGFVASWSDTGTQSNNTAYAPVYVASIAGTSDEAIYIGTDRQFAVQSILHAGQNLLPGTYSASIIGYVGFFTPTSGNFTVSNNISGNGITGEFISASTGGTLSSFTVH